MPGILYGWSIFGGYPHRASAWLSDHDGCDAADVGKPTARASCASECWTEFTFWLGADGARKDE